MANADFSGRAQSSHYQKTAEDYIAEIHQADENNKRKSIQRIISKSGGAPPGVSKRPISDYVINEREPASLNIDGIPIYTLNIPEVPLHTDRRKMQKFFAKEYGIELKSIFIICKSPMPSARIDCKSMEDALQIQLLQRQQKLIYKGMKLRAFPASASRQRPPLLEKLEVTKSETNVHLSIAEQLPDEVLGKIFQYCAPGDRISLQQVCPRWEYAVSTCFKEKYFDLSPKYLWGDASRKEFLTMSQLLRIAQYSNGEEYGWERVVLSGRSYTQNFRKAGITEFLRRLNSISLTELNLSGTIITPASLQVIASLFMQLKSFALGDCHGYHDELLTKIISNNCLEAFGIINNHNTSGKFLSAFMGYSSLLSFTVISCSKLKSSEVLSFVNASVSLQNLYIAQCPNLISPVADAIAQRDNTQLKRLHLEDNGSGFTHPHAMFGSWPNDTGVHVESLSLPQNLWIEQDFLRRVVVLTRIHHLDLSGCSATCDWWPALAESATLKSLAINKLHNFLADLGPNVISTYPPVLQGFKELQRHLLSLQFKDYDIEKLPSGMMAFLYQNRELIEFDIRGCNKLCNFQFLELINTCRSNNRLTPIKIFAYKTKLVTNQWRKKIANCYKWIELDFTPYVKPEELPNFRIL